MLSLLEDLLHMQNKRMKIESNRKCSEIWGYMNGGNLMSKNSYRRAEIS